MLGGFHSRGEFQGLAAIGALFLVTLAGAVVIMLGLVLMGVSRARRVGAFVCCAGLGGWIGLLLLALFVLR